MISIEHKMELIEKIRGGATIDEIMDIVWEDARAEAINFVVTEIIFPLLNEYDIGLWKDIEYIELADKWVEFKKRYKADDDSIEKGLGNWIMGKLKEQKGNENDKNN